MKRAKIILVVLAMVAIVAACYGVFVLEQSISKQPSRQTQEIRS